MKNWIKLNLLSNSGKLVSKRLNEKWFNDNNYNTEYNKIISLTPFVTDKLSQRLWHIYNNNLNPIKCKNENCNNIPTFLGFYKGYLSYCCNVCAQTDNDTLQKIKNTNLKKYGNEYGLQASIIREKIKRTNLKKYGVENVSQINSIKDKKKNTCNKNFGVDYFLQRQDLKEMILIEKYGVKNIQQISEVKNKTIKTRRSIFYDNLFTTNRLNDLATPLFSKDEYISGGLYEKYKFKCIKCSTEFLDCLEDGDLPRCTKCYKSNSYFQMEVYEYIKTLVDGVILNCKNIIPNQEIDIYIPKFNFAVECDGLYWHGEINGNKNKYYHLNKTLYCEKNNIHLIHIFEDDWMLKKDIVKSKLQNFLHKNDSIYARKCNIKTINNDICQQFLHSNHIQGSDRSAIQIGLYNNDELLMVATFGNLRIITGNHHRENIYELYRICSKINVVGGASKLLNYFIKNYKPHKIISYADRRYTYINNSFYDKIGFTKLNIGTPNYWYFGKNTNYKRFHRFGFAKHTLFKKLKTFDENLSEWENMKNNGYDRIWDCGSIKYELIC